MDIDHHFLHDILIIVMKGKEGRLVDADIDEFIDQMLRLSKKSAKAIAFNLSELYYLNSSGLGEVIKVKDSLLDKNIELVLINPMPRVRSLIDMVGITQFFKIIHHEDELG